MNIAQQYLDRFINNQNAYALQWGFFDANENKEKHGYTCIRNSRITNEMLMKHLIGKITLGVYSTNPDGSNCKWLCWDVDDEQEDELEQLTGWLSYFNIHSIRESRRPGRSGHLWIFLDQPISSVDAYRILRFGYDMSQLRGEYFPAQPELKNDQMGNLVRLPLGRHRKPSAKGVWGLFEGPANTTPEAQLFWFLEQRTNRIADISRILETVPNLDPPKVRKKYDGPRTPLIDKFPEDWPWEQMPDGELRGPCPLCLEEGHDTSEDNLFLNPDDNILYCFYGRKGQHSFEAIMKSVQKLKKTVTIA